MDCLYAEGMPQDERDIFWSAEIGEPIPYEHAFASDNDFVPEWYDCSQEGFR